MIRTWRASVRFRLAGLVAAGFLALSALALGGVGRALSKPVPARIGAPPQSLPAFSTVNLSVPGNQASSAAKPFSADAHGAPVAGWFAKGRPGGGAVLLLHGIRGSRLDMVERARYLAGQGYGVLLIDLPGHGESAAEHISYGIKESAAVSAALSFLAQTLPREKLGVIGVSLGAASLVFASRETNHAPDAVVLESMYPTIEAVANRLRLHLGAWAAPLTPLLLWQLPLRLGVKAEQLRPIEALPAIHAPLLIASGSQDRHTTVAETERLYAAANPPKALWVVDGAAHVNLYAFDPQTYERKVFGFLARHLRGQQ